jgi:hypothetical protein
MDILTMNERFVIDDDDVCFMGGRKGMMDDGEWLLKQ